MNRKQRRRAAKAKLSLAKKRPKTAAAADPQEIADQAKALHEGGRFAEVAVLYGHVVEDAAEHGEFETAINLLEKAIVAQPEDPVFHNTLGKVLLGGGDTVKAAAAFRQAVTLKADYGEAQVNLGAALDASSQGEAAAACFERALGIDPDNALTHRALGAVLVRLERPAEGEAHCRRAIELQPGDAETVNFLAVALRDQGRTEDAVAACRRGVELAPDNAAGHVHLAECLLLSGDLEEGFLEYEWRGRIEEAPLPGANLEQPRWEGGNAAGKTILVVGEQGFGDTLQFCRYAPLVKERGARAVLVVQTALVELCATMDGIDAVAGSGEELPDHDLHVPLLSLPYIFKTTLAEVPGDVPYVQAPPPLAAEWRQFLGVTREFRIGIAWQGNPRGAGNRGRSIPLRHFLALSRLPAVRLISLQKGAGQDQLENAPPDIAIENAASRCDSFADTAAVMANLVLVITSDTAVAHLAGALGRPVWTALKYAADWRWFLDRDDSPWYPTMRLFRQATPGDWPGVFDSIAEALKSILEEHHADG